MAAVFRAASAAALQHGGRLGGGQFRRQRRFCGGEPVRQHDVSHHRILQRHRPGRRRGDFPVLRAEKQVEDPAGHPHQFHVRNRGLGALHHRGASAGAADSSLVKDPRERDAGRPGVFQNLFCRRVHGHYVQYMHGYHALAGRQPSPALLSDHFVGDQRGAGSALCRGL